MSESVYDWQTDNSFGRPTAPPRQATQRQAPSRPTPPRQSRARDVAGAAGEAVGAAAGAFTGGLSGSFIPPVNVNIGRNGGNGNGGGGGYNGGGGATGGAADRHQGDRLIYAVERIEIRSDRDILAMARAINHLGRELHLILGMRAEEINGVLSTYKGKWYTFGSASRVKARIVSAHLKVSAEAAKALGVGALKMAHAFDRHFVKPEQEAKQRRSGQQKRPSFTIGDE